MSIEDSDSALAIVEAGRVRVHTRLREAIEDQLNARSDVLEVDADTVEALVEEAAARAGSALWRISLAEGAADLYGVSVPDALGDPALAAAERLVGTADAAEELWSEPWEEWAAEGEPVAEPVAAEPEAEPEPITYEAEPEPIPVAPEPAAPEPVAAAPEPVTAVSAPVAAPPEPIALRIPVVHAGGIDSIKRGDKDIELRLSDEGLDVLRRSSGAALGRLDWAVITAAEVREPKRRRKRKPSVLAIHTAGGDATFELIDVSPAEISSELEPMLARLRADGRLAR